ncbi:MAG: hypothetical protein HRT61_23455 [Ekhidna sp.]|nr:hypothetical protein [Ekhidna sp.]
MRVKILVFSFFLSIAFFVSAQDLDQFNAERIDKTKAGMLVLGTWATANIALSPILASRSDGSMKYFHQMNGYWNAVNLIIAGIGFYNATTVDPAGLSVSESLKEQYALEKILLFNAGLDLAYMAGGLYLLERAKREDGNTNRLKGFGQSIILQGGFLFAFDVAFYLVQRANGEKLLNYVDQLALSPTGFSLIWKI